MGAADRNDYPSSGAADQNRTECIFVDWDYNNGPFYIEAELIKTGAGGTPALGSISLTPVNCTP